MQERTVAVIGYDGTELLDIACITSTLNGANRLGGNPPYRVHLVTPGGRPITCDSGLHLNGELPLERLTGPLDTLVVAGGLGHRAAADNPRLIAHIRRLAAVTRRISSVCTGASLLAAAGLLDGKRATTHWIAADDLAARHPDITVDPDPIYIRDGDIATAAGMTSALDLMLDFIDEDHGPELPRAVARGLVTYLQRPGNQAQMSIYTAAPHPDHAVVRNITTHITAHLSGDLSTAALARREGVSERHLTRLFVRHMNSTPGRYVRRARVEAAAHLLATTETPIALVATRSGFHSAEALRQAFLRHYDVSPTPYRATAAARPRGRV
ncbi:GlxA family transcriptional regulator [Nocardia crassostreae]|uniref:GlxA family transcriptional regulator n=1 Tax=Nocardia crassostreae TaxID=53428 RepID=UPI00082C053B|nr:helix-turn-helix domain-containing protein [Nocardia crassostreae]